MRFNFLLLTFIFCLPLSGCLTTGTNFESDFAWIKKNATNKSDVQMMLGKPYATGNSGGVPTWTYAFYKFQPLRASYYKELKIYWDSNQSVKHFNFNTSFPEDLNKTLSHSNHAKPANKLRAEKSKSSSSYPTY